MLACLIYALGAASFHQQYLNDQYQNRFVVAAIIISTVLSVPDLLYLKIWLPELITFAILLSAFVHYIHPQWRVEIVEERVFTDEKSLVQDGHTDTATQC